MKKKISVLLSLTIILSMCSAVFADTQQTVTTTLTYELSCDGASLNKNGNNEVHVQKDAEITVTYQISTSKDTKVSTAQSNIYYNHDVLKLLSYECVSGSLYDTSNPETTAGDSLVLFNTRYDKEYKSNVTYKIGVMKFKVLKESGTTNIKNTSCEASSADGQVYSIVKRNLKVLIGDSSTAPENPETTVTVTYITGEGNQTSETLKSGESISLTAPTRTGYTFNGWTVTDSSGNTTATLPAGTTTYTPTGNVTLTAIWIQDQTNTGSETGNNTGTTGGGGGGGTVNYTLTYNTNGGTEITRDRVSAGTAVDLTGKVTTRDAYDFDGWYTDEQLTTPVSGNTFTVTANTTLYAKWKAKTISGDVTAPDDGSVTVTETDEATGTVTATTTWPDGSTRVTVTTTDGTATRTDTKANGITAVTVTDKDGNTVSAEANIPSDVAAAAASAITVPVEVKPAGSSDSAGTVKINIENNGSAKVEIPVTGVTNGTVALLLNEDGTEELLKDSVVTSDGLIVSVSGGSASFKIIDNTKRFDDVETSDWFNDAVMYAASREIMNGTSSNQFSPDVNMTRGMLAQVLYNYENKPDTDAENIFNDVGDTAWYADAVTWAADKGVVTGYGDGVFAPEQNITREQLATMLWRYAGKPAAAEQTVSFSDLDQVSSYASEAIAWATSNGILNGKGNNILDPKGYATRAQVAQMLKNFIAIQ
jgi:uncharacterized repeat protein (TIGR02543 family)